MSMHPEPRSRGEVVRRGAEVAFQAHAVTWFIVNLLLVSIWAAVGGGYPFWPFWTIAPWGAVVALHAWATYGWRTR